MPPPHSLTYCPAQVQRADGSGVWIQQKPLITQNQPQGTHLSGSPQTNPRTIFPLQKNNAKVGSPIMPGTAQQSPKKEKLKIPQVSCSMARPPRSPCHQAGVTGWSPLQPERCTDSITTFGIPRLLQHGEHTLPKRQTVPLPMLSAGFSSSFSMQNSHLHFHVQQKAPSDKFWVAFLQTGVS